jgi:hypothetical protein
VAHPGVLGQENGAHSPSPQTLQDGVVAERESLVLAAEQLLRLKLGEQPILDHAAGQPTRVLGQLAPELRQVAIQA